MKTFLRIGGIVLLVLILIIAGGFLYINASGIPKYPVEKLDIAHVSSPAAVARGKKLASMLCVNCHRDAATGKLTGTHMKDAPAEFGKIYSRNITQDPEFGIGSWTDSELAYLLRTGVGRDGSYLPPYMPKWPHMADEDMNAILSFQTQCKPCGPLSVGHTPPKTRTATHSVPSHGSPNGTPHRPHPPRCFTGNMICTAASRPPCST